MKWYLPRSKIITNKKEAYNIADEIKFKGNFEKVSVEKRILKGNKQTETKKREGYWIKVK